MIALAGNKKEEAREKRKRARARLVTTAGSDQLGWGIAGHGAAERR
jgi:hypothetical protein